MIRKIRKPKRRFSSRGALLIIAVLLVSSAAMRLSENAGRALALSPEKIANTPLKAEEIQTDTLEASSPNLAPMLEAFQAREARIKEMEAAIRDRIDALEIAEAKAEMKLAALEEAERKLSATLAIADTAAEGDLARLTKVYETMKPKQAAALFEQMDPEFAAGFIGRMRPDAAAAIMAGLSPDAAHMFSVVLAGRNAEAPRE